MKYIVLLILLFGSCAKQDTTIKNAVFGQGKINRAFLERISEPERALLSWYLYAYGNACDENGTKIKCRLLNGLRVDDECDKSHLQFLKKWMSKDVLATHKLKNCPNLSSKSSIQNSFDQIVLIRKGDTLSIQYVIKGLNNSQEKSWNISQKDSYLVEKNTLIKVGSEKF